MRHSYFGRKFSRTKNERRRLFQTMLRDIILRGKIRTTITKAKAIQPQIEKLITKAKIGSEQKRREVESVLGDRILVAKLFDEAQTRFNKRSSGFTRIVRLGARVGDATEEALLTFVDEAVVAEVVAPKAKKEKEAAPKEKATKEKAPEKKEKVVKKAPKKTVKKTAKKA